MNIFIDIETVPAQNPQVRMDIAALIEPPGNISKAETIAAWHVEKKPLAVEDAWRKTSFDGAVGHICVIGVAVDDNPAYSIFSVDWLGYERNTLIKLYEVIDTLCSEQPNERPVFIGHNLIEFDFRFMFQRSVILGIKPSRFIPFNCKPWDDGVYDTMQRWGARTGGSLDRITKAMGLGGKGDIDGSMVWNLVKDGRIAEVAKYCEDDVNLTRELYRRMTFQSAA